MSDAIRDFAISRDLHAETVEMVLLTRFNDYETFEMSDVNLSKNPKEPTVRGRNQRLAAAMDYKCDKCVPSYAVLDIKPPRVNATPVSTNARTLVEEREIF